MAFTMVVGYDGSATSGKALDAAVSLAKTIPEGEIIVTCAQDRPPAYVGMTMRGPEIGYEQFWDDLQKRVEEELAEAAKKVEKAGVKVATVCTRDRPADGVLKVARESGARMIVVGTKGAGARDLDSVVLGSTTNRLLHEAKGMPILVV